MKISPRVKHKSGEYRYHLTEAEQLQALSLWQSGHGTYVIAEKLSKASPDGPKVYEACVFEFLRGKRAVKA